MSLELILLLASILFFISMIVGKAGHKFGIPVLILWENSLCIQGGRSGNWSNEVRLPRTHRLAERCDVCPPLIIGLPVHLQSTVLPTRWSISTERTSPSILRSNATMEVVTLILSVSRWGSVLCLDSSTPAPGRSQSPWSFTFHPCRLDQFGTMWLRWLNIRIAEVR